MHCLLQSKCKKFIKQSTSEEEYQKPEINLEYIPETETNDTSQRVTWWPGKQKKEKIKNINKKLEHLKVTEEGAQGRSSQIKKSKGKENIRKKMDRQIERFGAQ